jgi:hypothetical protein
MAKEGENQETDKCTHLKVKAGSGSGSGRGTAGSHCAAPTSVAAGPVRRNYLLHSLAATHARQVDLEVHLDPPKALLATMSCKVPHHVRLVAGAVGTNPTGVQANAPTFPAKFLLCNAVVMDHLRRGERG